MAMQGVSYNAVTRAVRTLDGRADRAARHWYDFEPEHTYYVDPALGSDAADGLTPETPKATIQPLVGTSSTKIIVADGSVVAEEISIGDVDYVEITSPGSFEIEAMPAMNNDKLLNGTGTWAIQANGNSASFSADGLVLPPHTSQYEVYQDVPGLVAGSTYHVMLKIESLSSGHVTVQLGGSGSTLSQSFGEAGLYYLTGTCGAQISGQDRFRILNVLGLADAVVSYAVVSETRSDFGILMEDSNHVVIENATVSDARLNAIRHTFTTHDVTGMRMSNVVCRNTGYDSAGVFDAWMGTGFLVLQYANARYSYRDLIAVDCVFKDNGKHGSDLRGNIGGTYTRCDAIHNGFWATAHGFSRHPSYNVRLQYGTFNGTDAVDMGGNVWRWRDPAIILTDDPKATCYINTGDSTTTRYGTRVYDTTTPGLDEFCYDPATGYYYVNVGDDLTNVQEVYITRHGFGTVTYSDCRAMYNVDVYSVTGVEGHGFDVDDGSANSTFIRCLAYKNEGAGFFMWRGADHVYMSGCALVGNKKWGWYAGTGCHHWSVNQCLIYKNGDYTLPGAWSNAPGDATYHELRINNHCTDLSVTNSVLDQGDTDYCFAVANPALLTNFTFDNLLCNGTNQNDGDVTNLHTSETITFVGGDPETLAAWKMRDNGNSVYAPFTTPAAALIEIHVSQTGAGTMDGSTEANAAALASIVPTGISAGTTITLHGTLTDVLRIESSGTVDSPIIVQGDGATIMENYEDWAGASWTEETGLGANIWSTDYSSSNRPFVNFGTLGTWGEMTDAGGKTRVQRYPEVANECGVDFDLGKLYVYSEGSPSSFYGHLYVGTSQCVFVSGQSNVLVRDLEFRYTMVGAQFNCPDTHSATNVIVEDCSAHDTMSVCVGGGSDFYPLVACGVRRVDAVNVGDRHTLLHTSVGEGCFIDDNSCVNGGLSVSTGAFYIGEYTNPNTGTKYIRRNSVDGYTFGRYWPDDGTGVFVDNNSPNVVVEGNFAINCVGPAMKQNSSGAGCVWRNNIAVAVGSGDKGYAFHQTASTQLPNCDITLEHNTFINALKEAVYLSGYTGNQATMKNNIVMSLTSDGVYYNANTTLDTDGNLISVPGGDPIVSQSSGAESGTNSILGVDPVLNASYVPTAPAAIDVVARLSSTPTDFDGVARSNPTTPGAKEA